MTSQLINAINRRTFLRMTGALSGAALAAGGWMGTALGESVRWVYYLDPDCGTATVCSHLSDIGSHDCHSCKQCHSHAENKRWATPAAVWRAHPCCRCSLEKTRVTKAQFEALFGKGSLRRFEIDARW